ncbi:hypothetical protein AB832_07100 [Flavobacteriaceae bacterium (ex Bugula neritina AB1)]|nr:hypothetical protein AB832_07100 [Flavobacteriaceae bacterium (ex Bugula neritina AB1)]
MSKILIIGENSFLGRNLHSFLKEKKFQTKIISHKNITESTIKNSSIVINFAINPIFYEAKYRNSINFDLSFIDFIKNSDTRYIFLSSRKVYSSFMDIPLKETDPTYPSTNYGKNKLISEQIVLNKVQEKALVLRLSNVVGFEPIVGRKTIMAYIINSIVEKRAISVNTTYNTRKDFLPLPLFCEVLTHFISNWQSGIFNVGSGIGYKLGEVIDLITGNLNFHVNVTYKKVEQDSFILDVNKMKGMTKKQITKTQIDSYFNLIGRNLSYHLAQQMINEQSKKPDNIQLR